MTSPGWGMGTNGSEQVGQTRKDRGLVTMTPGRRTRALPWSRRSWVYQGRDRHQSHGGTCRHVTTLVDGWLATHLPGQGNASGVLGLSSPSMG